MTDRPSREAVEGWAGYGLDELAGGIVGRIDGAYAETGRPEWLVVRPRRFVRRRLVPASDAVAGIGHVWVPYARAG